MASDPFREARERSEIEYESMLSAAQGEAEARVTARDAAATSIEAKAVEYLAERQAQNQPAIDQARGQVLTAKQQFELLQQPGRVVEVPFRVDPQTMSHVTDLELVEGAIASAEAAGEGEWAMQWKTHLAALNQLSEQADPHYDTQVDAGFELKHQINAAADADPRFAGIVGTDQRAAVEADLAAVFEAAGVESRDALAAETVELRERLDAALDADLRDEAGPLQAQLDKKTKQLAALDDQIRQTVASLPHQTTASQGDAAASIAAKVSDYVASQG